MNDGPYRINAFSGTRSITSASEIDVLMLHVQYDIIDDDKYIISCEESSV